MTTPLRPDLVELAARCEQATGPDRELDKLIAETLALPHGPRSGWSNDENGDHWIVEECSALVTASLDAAMTLVPEGTLWKVDYGIAWSDEEPASGGRNYRAGVGIGDVPAQWHHGWSAATPALALTAACLRARASMGDS